MRRLRAVITILVLSAYASYVFEVEAGQQPGVRATTREQSMDSVVHIAIRGTDAEQRRFKANFGGTHAPMKSNGSGFAVAPGVFVTNRHVVEDIPADVPAPRIALTAWVGEGHRDGTAEVLAISQDRNVDLAVLKSSDTLLQEVPWVGIRCDAPSSGRDYYVRATAAVPIGDEKRIDHVVATTMFRRIHVTAVIDDLPVKHVILFEPETMGGNSGSPIFDVSSPFGTFNEGVLGVVRGNVLLKGWQGVGEAVIGRDVVAFLRKHGVDHEVIGDRALCDPK